MARIDDEVLVAIVNKGKGMTTRQVVEQTPHTAGSEALVALRLAALATAGRIRRDVTTYPGRRQRPLWWPV